MKNIILITLISFSGLFSFAQNTPVVETSAPKSNNALPSGGTLGSNSGVNPMGNPGTISNYSSNSNAINDKLEASPNIEPGVFLNSSPEGTFRSTTVTNAGVVQQQTTVTNNGAAITTVVEKKLPDTSTKLKAVAKTKAVPSVPVSDVSIVPVNASVEKTVKITTKSGAKKQVRIVPVLGNYVPENIVENIKTKYGTAVYSIIAVRVASSKKVSYLVRLLQDGKSSSELYSE